MIPASKGGWFNRWFAAHARGRLQKTFGRIWVQGLAEAQEAARTAPLLVVSNHGSWWDPLVALHVVNHLLPVDAYALMDARNLRRFPFFRKVGAFGVDLDQPRDGARGLRYAAAHLTAPGKAVWIFPQGGERPWNRRPLGFQSGAAWVSCHGPHVRTLPVGMRYEFGPTEKPELFLAFGEAFSARGKVQDEKARQEAAVLSALDRIEAALQSEPRGQGFDVLFEAPSSPLGDLATRWLAWWTGRGME